LRVVAVGASFPTVLIFVELKQAQLELFFDDFASLKRGLKGAAGGDHRPAALRFGVPTASGDQSEPGLQHGAGVDRDSGMLAAKAFAQLRRWQEQGLRGATRVCRDELHAVHRPK